MAVDIIIFVTCCAGELILLGPQASRMTGVRDELTRTLLRRTLFLVMFEVFCLYVHYVHFIYKLLIVHVGPVLQ